MVVFSFVKLTLNNDFYRLRSSPNYGFYQFYDTGDDFLELGFN
jgi:hypothetical protein